MLVKLSKRVPFLDGHVADVVAVRMPASDHFDDRPRSGRKLGWRTMSGFTGISVDVLKRLRASEFNAISEAMAVVFAEHEQHCSDPRHSCCSFAPSGDLIRLEA